jgi:hypothetical protein
MLHKVVRRDKGMVGATHVAGSPSILVNPPIDHGHFDLWRNQSPMMIDVKVWDAIASADIPY